ncbi:MAG: hypothetical protein L3V56_02625 [Candidatus Magnetoovum sp. WYHC-5]|nr:hypothetical protein [Candidatus Magnetoovum sp. WYHC-5]
MGFIKALILVMMIFLSSVSYATEEVGLYSELPGNWRPFADNSPWNTPIPADVKVHPDSPLIMETVLSEAKNIRLAAEYIVPVWVIDSTKVDKVKVEGSKIFDRWDKDLDGWSDDAVPVTRDMWEEPTEDGHLCIIDPIKNIEWDFSAYRWLKKENNPLVNTFNIWQINGDGVCKPDAGKKWQYQGSRGSGFPLIAGLIRPQELQVGEIRHALVFTFPKNRMAEGQMSVFMSPACRSDGKYEGNQYPVEGMRFQLDPALTEADFDKWGLNREGKVVARALQKYGMFLGDNGGAMAIQVQLLGPSRLENRLKWEAFFSGFYKNVEKIPADKFRVVYTWENIIKK